MQKQILRLPPPTLHPNDEDLSLGTPVKKTSGAPCIQDDSLVVGERFDAEVLEWLRSKGEGHLTRINGILTNLMEAERRMGRGK